MARLFTLGFEVQSSSTGAEDQNVVFAGSASITTSNVRSGAAAASCSSVTNGNLDLGGVSGLGTVTARSYFARMYWRPSAATPGVRSSILAPFVSGGNWHAVCWETDGTLSLYDKG